VLFVSGINDVFAPPVSQQLIPFTSIEQPGSLLALQHNGTSKLPKFVIGPDQPLARQEMRGMALAFFDQHATAAVDHAEFQPRGAQSGGPWPAPVPLNSRAPLCLGDGASHWHGDPRTRSPTSLR
jgi:hypothetical protein